jgi:hypothetical protein
MFLMRRDTLRGQVGGGWGLEIESFLGPVKWHRADRRVILGPKKLEIPCEFITNPSTPPPPPILTEQFRNRQRPIRCILHKLALRSMK